MHVLVINVFFAPHSYGGATIVAEEVARALAARGGVRVSAISAMTRADLPPYAVVRCEAGGIVNHMINLPAGRSKVQHYANAEVAAKIAGIARDLAPDLAHVHCVQEIGADCLTVLKTLGIPVILSTHDFWWLCERQFMIRPDGRYCGQNPIRIARCRGCVDDFGAAETRGAYLAQAAGWADLVTCPSAFAAGIYARSGFAPGRLRVWENGVRLPGPGFAAAQAARRAADPRLVFGFVGGPSQIKGWPLLGEAFRDLPRGDFRGHLVEGSLDGSWWRGRDISVLAGAWEVVPRYAQDGIDGFFAEIDVLLFLSQWKETFGLTVREALARGVRVIQTDAGGAAEHGAADHVRVIPIGAGAKVLRKAVLAELETGPRDMPGVAVRSYGAQAEAFLDLARPLAAARRATFSSALPVTLCGWVFDLS
ncbi:glycosyltransferase [Ovoidimarina sediminis]|uniref:glycosyltransferase n=1 Tax=Ovoidimarina sediminis TaxID=3079856 RepID=UPI002914C43B|nr:glycosyltransferase [Rhodophyticola sp. MJ-SS7]MDU8946714.1 glycosyltransferase [Rhodophyticola sp. MJ-SS7]